MKFRLRLFPPAMVVVMLVALHFQGCKAPEQIPEERIRPMGAVRLYKKALENAFDYHHFSIRRIQLQVDNGESRTTFRAGIQAVRDQAVLVSVTKLNLLVVRIMLTPDSVVFVNYFEKSGYAGGYEPFSRMLGIPLDFQTVQAIVSAHIFSLFDDARELRAYATRIEEGMYVLQPEEEDKLAKLEEKGKEERAGRILRRREEEVRVVQTFFFDPALFVIRKIRLEERETPRVAEMRFDDYQPTGGKYYPAAIDLKVSSPGVSLTVNARMGGFSTDESEFVPLRIPEKYERVSLN